MRMEWWFSGLLAFAYIIQVTTEETCHYIEVIGDMYCAGVPIFALKIERYPMNVSKLVTLDISSAQITNLDYDVFDEKTILISLNMNDNNITHLDERLFLKTKDLQNLYLARNHLSTLHDDIFIELFELTHLDISGNPLKTLSDKLFRNQKNLLYLYANTIGITSVPTDAIEPLTFLRTLHFNDNNINCSCCQKNITIWAMQRCLNLVVNCKFIGLYEVSSSSIEDFRQNYCGENSFPKRPNYDRVPHPGSEYFNFRREYYNSHRDLPQHGEFRNRLNRRRFRDRFYFGEAYQDACSNDSVAIIDPGPINCPKLQCRYLVSINQMNCDSIPLKTIDLKKYPFEERNFTDFILDNNELSTLDPDTFNAFDELLRLSLRGNHLEYIDTKVFRNLNKLRILDLSDNRLGDLLEKNLFFSQKRLQALYMNNNRISSIHEELFEPLKRSLKRLFMWGNPLNCDCNLRPVFFSIADTKIVHKATCMYPMLYRDKNWDILREATYCRLALDY
ncbi:hypothetical protein C0J52_28193 [Blattella germanica]|nr:hypothetical protein C0J52_28193 [Blattella germanica]